MRALSSLLSLLLLSACAGYAADYWRPRSAIVASDLPRFGLDASQVQCVGDGLSGALSVWQLRQLSLAAEALARTGPLVPGDLIRAAAAVEDDRVAPAVERVAAACSIRADTPASTASAATATPGSGDPIWINLGAAATGQAIAVEASSLAEDAQYRSAWFRLTDPGQAGRSGTAYLLRIDCAARTINPMALRRYDAGGALAEERSHGPQGEGALPVESGTVMEIAYLALCT